MKIGILNADQLTPEVHKQYGSYSDMIERLLHSVQNTHTYHAYQVAKHHYPTSIDECDAYLITGSKANAYDDTPWIKTLRSYIVALDKHRKKLVGICFGHQIIAQALGGLVRRHEHGWGVGITTNQVLITQPWMKPVKQHILLRVSHQDQVTRLPPQAQHVTTNTFCVNSSFQINEHIITFQGHPEFTAEYLQYLIQGRQKIIGQQRYQQALTSLHLAVDNAIVAQWILNFMTHPDKSLT